MSDESLREVLAGIGLEPDDLPPAVRDVVQRHLEDHEPSMDDRLRAEVSAIPDRRTALAHRIFGVDADDEPDPPPAA